MEGQSVRWQTERRRYLTSGHSVRPRLDQQEEGIEAVFLGECGKSGQGLGFSHIQYLLKHRPIGKFISIIVEINPDDDQRIAYAAVNIALSIFRVPQKVRFGS